MNTERFLNITIGLSYSPVMQLVLVLHASRAQHNKLSYRAKRLPVLNKALKKKSDVLFCIVTEKHVTLLKIIPPKLQNAIFVAWDIFTKIIIIQIFC